MFSENKIKFDHISIDKGLSQSVVDCIFQDCQGFMWFGTQDGLNRYDGYNFTVYRNDSSDKNSISDNTITCLMEDSNNDMWIGTKAGGLNKYDRENNTFTRYCHDDNDPDSISSNIVRNIYEDHEGELWICTTYGGLNRFNRERHSFIRYYKGEFDPDGSNAKSIRALIEDKENNIWIATWGEGVKKYDRENNKFICFKNKINVNPNANRINSLYEDSFGNLWAGTNDGLQNINKETGQITEYKFDESNPGSISCNFLSEICEDRNGVLWICTKEGGLNKFCRETDSFIHFKNDPLDPESISSDSIYSIYPDRSGIIWIGTNGDGISKFNSEKKLIKHFKLNTEGKKNLISNKITCFCEENADTLWIGTLDSGLMKYEFTNNKLTHFNYSESDDNSITNDRIAGLLIDKENNLWIGTSNGGLNKFDLKKNKFTGYKRSEDININSISVNTIFTIKADAKSMLWLGTSDGGLNKFDPVKEHFTHYTKNINNSGSINSNRIRALLIDNEGKIWIGHELEGVDEFDPVKNNFIHYKNNPDDNNSLSNNSILSINQSKDGKIWIGSLGGGLICYDKEKNEFKNYQVKDGLPNNTVYGILEDDYGCIWVSTNNGLSKFNTENSIFKNYDVRDGLQSNEFNHSSCLKLSSGELVFGGINGFNIFFPEDFTENKHIPQIAFTYFQIFNKKVPVAKTGSVLKKTINTVDEIILPYSDSVFSFEFTSLDFNIPGKNQYTYMMEGFDKDWVYSGNRRFVTYTNLNPGEYIFKVKGSNNDGIWNEEGKKINLKIKPPFWKTIWFKGLSVLTAAGVIRNIYQSKLNEVKKEKKAQEEFTKRLLETQEGDRKRIAAELHDSIGHDLLITKNKLQLSVQTNTEKEAIIKDVNDVTDILSSTINEVREISYNLHPYQIERLGISKAIQSIIDRTGKSTNIKFISNIDLIDRILSPDIEISLYRIIQECMNNIVKHSSANEVIINIKKDRNNISIFLSDNGKGFDQEKINSNSGKHGFGLKGMIERVKLFNGKFEINSSPGNGTDINISIHF